MSYQGGYPLAFPHPRTAHVPTPERQRVLRMFGALVLAVLIGLVASVLWGFVELASL